MLNKIRNLFGKKNSTNTSAYERIDSLFDTLNDEVIILEIGEDLIEHDSSITEIISCLREQIKEECGFIMPTVSIKHNYVIQENQFNIYIQEKLIEQRFVIPTEDNIKEEVYDSLKTSVYNNLDSVFTNEITEKYINAVKKNNGMLIWNITNILSIIDIKTILSEIIMKGKSINNINYIFEKMGEYILSDGIAQTNGKKYNPHIISQAISRYLYK